MHYLYRQNVNDTNLEFSSITEIYIFFYQFILILNASSLYYTIIWCLFLFANSSSPTWSEITEKKIAHTTVRSESKSFPRQIIIDIKQLFIYDKDKIANIVYYLDMVKDK